MSSSVQLNCGMPINNLYSWVHSDCNIINYNFASSSWSKRRIFWYFSPIFLGIVRLKQARSWKPYQALILTERHTIKNPVYRLLFTISLFTCVFTVQNRYSLLVEIWTWFCFGIVSCFSGGWLCPRQDPRSTRGRGWRNQRWCTMLCTWDRSSCTTEEINGIQMLHRNAV